MCSHCQSLYLLSFAGRVSIFGEMFEKQLIDFSTLVYRVCKKNHRQNITDHKQITKPRAANTWRNACSINVLLKRPREPGKNTYTKGSFDTPTCVEVFIFQLMLVSICFVDYFKEVIISRCFGSLLSNRNHNLRRSLSKAYSLTQN